MTRRRKGVSGNGSQGGGRKGNQALNIVFMALRAMFSGEGNGAFNEGDRRSKRGGYPEEAPNRIWWEIKKTSTSGLGSTRP